MRYRKEFHEWEGVPVWFWPRIAHVLTPLKRRPFLRARRKGGRPRAELERWRDSYAASRSRAVPFWRWSLDLIWITEFEPLLPKEL